METRTLFRDEIENILSAIPPIKAATLEIAEVNRNNIINVYDKSLSKIRVPNKDVAEFITRLKIKIYNAFKRSETSPGSPVGPRAAEAIAVPMIQATLDSFKTTGSSISTYGEEAMREIISLSNRKPEIIRIFFNKPVSDDEILRDKRPDLIEVKVSDFMHLKDKYQIGDPYDIIGEEEPFWYELYRSSMGNNGNFVLSNVMLRYHLNVNLMYEHNITATKIINTILGFQGGRKHTSNEDVIVCIPSPSLTKIVKRRIIKPSGKSIIEEDEVAYAFIDIFSLRSEFSGITELYRDVVDPFIRSYLSIESYFDTILVPSFADMHIKGIRGIKGVFIERTIVTQIISTQEKEKILLTDLQMPPEKIIFILRQVFGSHPVIEQMVYNYNTTQNAAEIENVEIQIWKLYLSARRIKTMAIGHDQLIKLIQISGMIVLPYTETELENGLDTVYLKVLVPLKPANYVDVISKSTIETVNDEKDEVKRNKLILDRQKIQNEELTPLKFIDFKTALEKREDDAFTEKKQKEIKDYVTGNITDEMGKDTFEFSIRRKKDPEKSVILANEIVYAIAEGKNLKEVLKRSDVDPKKTYSNDFFEIFGLFGIEGLRNFILEELVGFSTSSGGEYNISPQHLLLLADFMTYRGVPTKVQYTGLQDEFEETFKGIGFERPITVLSESALIGRKDKSLSLISSTFVGREANIGSNFKDEFASEKYIKSLEQEFDNLSIEQMEKEILALSEITDENNLVGIELPTNQQPLSSELKVSEFKVTPPKIQVIGSGEKMLITPPIIPSPTIEKVIKNTLDKAVSVIDIIPSENLRPIVIKPIGEEAVISQLSALSLEQQENVDKERREVPRLEVVVTNPEVDILDLLAEGNSINLPSEINI